MMRSTLDLDATSQEQETTYVRTVSAFFEFDHPPEAVWPLVANTDRMNRAAGMEDVEYTHEPSADGGSLRYGKSGNLQWLEHPYEWEKPHYFRVAREYSQGMFLRNLVEFLLTPTPRGCRLEFRFSYTTRKALMSPLLALGMKLRVFPGYLRAWRRMNASLKAQAQASPFVPRPQDGVKWTPEERRRWETRFEGAGISRRLTADLLNWLQDAQEPDLVRIRPFALARRLDAERFEVLEALLKATKLGLFQLSWDLICPSCLGAKNRVGGLSSITEGNHCDACNIDFRASFESSVEVSFQVHPAIKEVRLKEFCVGGPRNTPHFESQRRLPAGTCVGIRCTLEPGIYRLRSLQSRDTCLLHVSELAREHGDLEIEIGSPDQPRERSVALGAGSIHLQVTNATAHECLVMIEHADWLEDACKASVVTSLQEFRDAFSADVLAPGQDISVGSIALMFTDLKGSTAMYERIGDAAAFRLVREHFEILRDCVRRNRGSIVKTIGDAVMASFFRAEDATRAAIEMHQRIQERSFPVRERDERLQIKIGIHFGSCFAVNSNGKLDYFGAAVNTAARTESQCDGGDIVLSSEAYREDGVARALEDAGLRAEAFRRRLKGYEREFELYKVPCIGYSEMGYGQGSRSA